MKPRVLTASVLLAVVVIISSIASASAQRTCDACRINQTTPRPTPIVVGITPAPSATVGLPPGTLPPTDE